MSEPDALIVDLTARLLAELCSDRDIREARSGAWPGSAWSSLESHGVTRALVEGEQGYGVVADEGLALVGLVGRFMVPLPLAETMIGNALLARAGLSVCDGVVALIPAGEGVALRVTNGKWHAIGTAQRIAWGRAADALVIQQGDTLAVVRSGFRAVEHGGNLADMPRDRVEVDAVAEAASAPPAAVLEAGALVRALMMAGALSALAEQTVRYVSERVQFGRTLSSFQVVQHQLARLASEAAAAGAAADLAAAAFATAGPQAGVAIAAARSRIGDAVGVATGIAHQLHGAIGFAEEHRLHWFTTALWSWRDEFGTAGWWTRELGRHALAQSKSGYWPFITSV